MVVDASATVELLLRRGAFESLADVLLAPGQVMHAPHLLDADVAQTLRRLEDAGTLTRERAREALADLRALRIVRHAHLPLLDRAWALRTRLPAFDALYMALAEGLGAPLITMDDELAVALGVEAEELLSP